MKANQFSVSMCVYGKDNPDHFDAALASIANQTVKPTEIVLVVDGPVPDTIENIIQKHKSSAHDYDLNVVYLEKNMGHGEARRICFNRCSCDLIALMDADDLSVPDRFEKQLAFFEKKPGLSIVGGYIHEFIDTPEHCVGKRIVPTDDAEIKEYMKKRCPMNQVTVMFRKQDVAEVGGYIDWYCEEEYYLWIRLALSGKKFGNVAENLVDVRVGDEMYSRRGGMKYFKSEARLQKFMLNHKVIGFGRYLINVSERLVLQVLMPNRVRGFLFQKLAREK